MRGYKMRELTRQNAKIIVADVRRALEEVAKKHSIHIQTKNFSFNSTDGTGSGRWTVAVSETGKVCEYENYKKGLSHWRARGLGLTPEMYGRIINVCGTEYEFVGYKTSARKNCLVVVNQLNGKVMVANTQIIPLILNAK